MNYVIIGIISIIVLFFLFFVLYKNKESFLGALTQLNSKGSMDYYLTGTVVDACGGDPLCLYDEPVKKSQNTMFQ